MYVYLVQHGESKSEEEDPQRRLTDKGIGEVHNVADFLRPLKLAVDAIWHSDKARAQQTGELLAGAVMARDGLVQREGLGPKDQVASTKELLEQTGSIDKRRKLLCEPGGILLRGQILPPHLCAVRPEPVVALFAEWHKQGVPETIVLTQGIARNSDDHFVLRDVDAQRAMDPVPPVDPHCY